MRSSGTGTPADDSSARSGSTLVSRRAASALLLLVILLWGANWPVMKLGLQYMPPFTFAAMRMILGALVMFPAAAWGGRLRFPSRNDWPIVLSVGILQMAGFMGLVISGLQFVPAGRSSILAYTTALWVVPLATLVLRERIGRRKLAGFAIGMAGVAVLFNPMGFDWSDHRVLLGNGLLMLAALLWALQIVQVRGHRWEGSPLSLAPWQFAVAVCLLAPAALIFEHGHGIRWSPALGLILLYNGPVATAFAFWAVLTVTRALPAVTTSLGTLGVPITGMLLSSLVLGEPLTATNVSGLVLLIAGLAMVALAERRGGGGGSGR